MISAEERQTMKLGILHELEEPAREDLERRLFEDSSAFEEYEVLEEEMLEAYLHDELPAEEAERITELRSLYPYMERKIAFTAALIDRAQRDNVASISAARRGLSPRSRSLLTAVAAAVGLVVFGMILHETKTLSSRPRIARTSAPLPAAGPSTTAEVPKPAQVANGTEPVETPSIQRKKIPPAAHVIDLVLATAVTRGGSSANELKIPEGTDAVRIHVPVDPAEAAAVYRATVRRSGTEVWSGTAERHDTSAGPDVTFQLPADDLPDGPYEIELDAGADPGGEPIAFFDLDVRR
ncbi:MAG: hypothetical protein WBX15_16805 [Thermoanaerobaculia bacterium]